MHNHVCSFGHVHVLKLVLDAKPKVLEGFRLLVHKSRVKSKDIVRRIMRCELA